MTQEEKDKLLEEAKLRYPPGTKVKSLFHLNNPILKVRDTYFTMYVKNLISVHAVNSGIKVVVYENGVWAEIISKPKVKPSKSKPFYVVVTEENKEVLSKFFHSKSDEYEGYQNTWVIKVGSSYVYPQIEKDVWGYSSNCYSKLKDHNKISFEQFLELYPEYKEDRVTTIPEYVELVKDWSVDGEYIREIFELSTLNNLSKFKHAPSKDNFRTHILRWIKEGCFKPSTKEAYDKQFDSNTIEEEWIPKVGEWVYRIKPGNARNHVTKDKVYQITEISSHGKTLQMIDDNGIKTYFDKCNFRKALLHEIPYTNGIDPVKSNNTNLSYYKYKIYIDVRKTFEVYGRLFVYINGIKQSINNPLLEYVSIDKLTKKQFLDIIKGTYYISIEGDFLKEESDEFVLPEKWCCILTEENKDVLFKWANFNFKIECNGKNYITYQKTWGGWVNRSSKGYIDITFEQFKKYVLKEDIMSIINHECKVNIDKNHSFNTFKQSSHLLSEMINFYKETSLTQQSLKTELELIPIKKLKTFNN